MLPCIGEQLLRRAGLQLRWVRSCQSYCEMMTLNSIRLRSRQRWDWMNGCWPMTDTTSICSDKERKPLEPVRNSWMNNSMSNRSWNNFHWIGSDLMRSVRMQLSLQLHCIRNLNDVMADDLRVLFHLEQFHQCWMQAED